MEVALEGVELRLSVPLAEPFVTPSGHPPPRRGGGGAGLVADGPDGWGSAWPSPSPPTGRSTPPAPSTCSSTTLSPGLLGGRSLRGPRLPHGQGRPGVRGARRRAARPRGGPWPRSSAPPGRWCPPASPSGSPAAWTTWSAPCCAGTAGASGLQGQDPARAGRSSRCGQSAARWATRWPCWPTPTAASGATRSSTSPPSGGWPTAIGLVAIEQPFAPDDLVGHARLARRIDVPVCLDESIGSLAQLDSALTLEACGAVSLKAGRVGGLVEARRIHQRCRAAGCPCAAAGCWRRGWAGPQPGRGRAARVQPAARPGAVVPLLPAGPHRTLRVPGWHDDRAQRARPRRRSRPGRPRGHDRQPAHPTGPSGDAPRHLDDVTAAADRIAGAIERTPSTHPGRCRRCSGARSS